MQKNKATALLLCTVIILSMTICFIPIYIAHAAGFAPGEGTGTFSDPYIIDNPSELVWMSENYASIKDKYFLQTTDIDMTGIQFTPIGNGDTVGSLGSLFTGQYDGQSFEIQNLTINSGLAYVALFQYAGGTVKNITLTNVSITSTSTYTYSCAAGIAGYAANGTIQNCAVSGTISHNGAANYSYTAGIASSAWSTIQNCSSTASLSNVNSGANIGGISAYTGSNSVTITKCYFAGSMSGAATTKGGIVGNYYQGSISNSVFLSTSASFGLASSSSNTGCTSANSSSMKTAATYTGLGWDFSNIWKINEGVDYPRFITTPGQPANVTAVTGDGQITVSWNAASKSSGYKVYIGTVSGVYGTPVSSASTSKTITGLTNGTKYYIAVKAVHTEEEGLISAEVTGVPHVPVNDLSAAPDTGKVDLTFSSPAGADTVELQQSTNGGTSYSAVTGTSLTNVSTSASVTGLTNGVTYKFRLRLVYGSEAYYSNIVTVNAGNPENKLSALTVSGCTLNEAFASTTYVYTSSVGSGVSSITVTATMQSALSSMTIDSTPQTSGVSKTVDLGFGDNVITIAVTAENGVVQNYTMTVARALPDTAETKEAYLGVDEWGTYSVIYLGSYSGVPENCALKFDLSSYSGNLVSASLNIYVSERYETSGEGTSFDIYGSDEDSWADALPSTWDSTPILSGLSDLKDGWNAYNVSNYVVNHYTSVDKTITFYMAGTQTVSDNCVGINSYNHSEYKPYLLLVFESSDARLLDIKIDGKSITGFSPDTYTYNYVAPYGTDLSTLVFTSTLNDAAATNGSWVYDSLNKKWCVTVTAENGDTATYTVNVSVAPSTDATLSSISVNGSALAGFSPAMLGYTYDVPYGTDGSALILSSAVNDTNAAQGSWTYDSVNTKWSITVTAEDGTTTKTYTVTVNELSNSLPVASNVQISGTLKYGQTLTGSYTYSDEENDVEGTSTYKWYRADDASGTSKTVISGAAAKTYVLQVADIGKYISFEVTPEAQAGASPGASVESNYTAAVQKADCATATGIMPVLSSRTDTSITLVSVAGYEYAIAADGAGTSAAAWQASNVFSELTDGTAYDFYQRVKETSTHQSSGISQKLDVTTFATPTVTDGSIFVSGASGPGGTFIIGDTVTAIWDNTDSGDNNSGISSVTVDFGQFGGYSAVAAANNANIWTATYTIAAGSIDAVNRNVSVTATNSDGIAATTADTANATVDNIAPTVTAANISISGATGTGGAYVIGDTITAKWNNTAAGDNNSDTISAVTVDFSEFGGGSAVSASNSAGTWTATYTISAGMIDTANRNVSVTATDNVGNSITTADNTNAAVDNAAPTVTAANIFVSGGSGTGGTFIIGDTVTATWNNTASGDNNSDSISSVTVDFSQFGGDSSVAASNSAGTWTAVYTITAGAIDAADRNVSVTAVDNAGNSTTKAGTSNETVDNAAPAVTAANISVSGATGTGDVFIIGDTVTATWNNAAGGDNNNDISAVTVDFSEFGGGSVSASNSVGTWTATYTIISGAIDAADCNVSVTAVDNAGNRTIIAGTSNATVDNAAPAVTAANISLSGATGTGGVFIIGDTVTATWNNTTDGDNNSDISAVTVNFSQFGGDSAVFASNSVGTWTAAYNVVSGNISAVNRNVSVTATDNGGNIITTEDNTNATIDNKAPVIDSVNVPANGTYTAGQNLNFTVNFSENVTVNTTGGTPRLSLTVGTSTVYASYQSGSGTSAIVFRYTVEAGRVDSDGIDVGTLSLNGGIIRDVAGNSANLAFTGGTLTEVLVKLMQTISFANPGAQDFGTSPTLTATSSSGLPVIFTSETPDVCTISNAGVLTLLKAGTATISANQAGNNEYLPAATVSRSFTINTVIPGAPTIGTAIAGNGKVTVSFTAPSSNGGSDITGYTATSSSGGIIATGASSPITVTGLTNGVAYTFTVTATNSAGTSAPSSASNSATPTAPATPTPIPTPTATPIPSVTATPTATPAPSPTLTPTAPAASQTPTAPAASQTPTAPAASQTPTAPAASQTPSVNTRTITGTLLDSDGTPMAGYVVELHSDPVTTITDAQGHYTFNDVDYTKHELIVKTSNGEKVAAFALKFSEGNEFDTDVKEDSVNITFTKSTVTVNIEVVVVADRGEASISKVSSVEIPRTGDSGGIFSTLLWIIIVFVSIVIIAALIFVVVRTRKREAS